MNEIRSDICETKLLECNTSTKQFKYAFANEIYECKCLDVYDGDTITVAFKPKLDTEYYQFKIRLLGINSLEIRNKNLTEKQKAIEARDFLIKKILGRIITIKCAKFDSFGRLLAYVFLDNENINDTMVSGGYAVEYMV